MLEAQARSGTDSAKWIVLLAAFLGWMFDGLEMGIFPQIARSALSKLLANAADENTIKWWNQVVDASFLFGAAAGGLIFGWLGDRIGRVKSMSFSILLYSGFTGLLYFARTPGDIAMLRFIAAVGMGGEWALGVALVMEVWDEKHRPLLAGLIGAAANVGMALIGLIGLLIRIDQDNWRKVALVGAAPALLTFLIRIFVPESPRWTEAQAVEKTRPLAELVGQRRLRSSVILAIVFASVALLGTWGAVQKIPPWADGMAPKGSGAGSKALIALALGAIVGCMAASLLSSMSRRVAYFLLCAASLIVCQVMFNGFNEFNRSFIVMSFITGAVTAAVYGWLPLYLPELFPTRVRATGQGIAFNFGRILAGCGALWGGTIGGSYARMGAIVSLVYILGMAFIWIAPETRGEPMPQ